MANIPVMPTLTEHDHNVVTGVKFYTCEPSAIGSGYYTMITLQEWTQYVIDYSYDCGMDDNTRTTASVTLSGYGIMDAVVGKIEHETTSDAQAQQGHMWNEHTYYHLIKTYDFPSTNTHAEWDLGYFTCANNGTEISTTDNNFTLSLIGLSALLQPEYGGTPNKYRQGLTTDLVLKRVTPWLAGSQPIDDYTVRYTGNPDPNYKSTESGTPTYTDQKYWDVTYESKTVTNWTLLSIYIKYGTVLNNDILYSYVNGSWGHQISAMDTSRVIPISSCDIDYSTLKLGVPMVYEEKEFPYDASKQDIVQFVLDQFYLEGRYWIDESLCFHIKGKTTSYNFPITTYQYYGDLIINENRSYDDSGVYNNVNVVSKVTLAEAEYTFFGRADNPNVSQTTNIRAMYVENNSFQSDAECVAEAQRLVQDTSWGHETFTVTLVDNYCSFLTNCSNKVGCPIEYKTLTGYTVPCMLEKVSYSSNNITMVLRPMATSTAPNSNT